MAEESDTEFVDPFDSGRDGEPDSGEGEGVDKAAEANAKYHEVQEPPALMKASDLLPPEEEADPDEIPPTPEEAHLQSLPLAQREQRKLSEMTPEQRKRYDAAQAEIMSHPAVAAFAQEEARARIAKEDVQAAFLAAYRKKQKEKA